MLVVKTRRGRGKRMRRNEEKKQKERGDEVGGIELEEVRKEEGGAMGEILEGAEQNEE